MHWGEKYYDLVCSLCWLPHQQLDVASLGKHKFPGNSTAPHLGLHKVISNLLCLLDLLIISKCRFENMMTFPSFEVYMTNTRLAALI